MSQSPTRVGGHVDLGLQGTNAQAIAQLVQEIQGIIKQGIQATLEQGPHAELVPFAQHGRYRGGVKIPGGTLRRSVQVSDPIQTGRGFRWEVEWDPTRAGTDSVNYARFLWRNTGIQFTSPTADPFWVEKMIPDVVDWVKRTILTQMRKRGIQGAIV